MEHVYGVATGWLGWSDEQAMNTPIPKIFIALDARIKWVRMCNGEDVRTPSQKLLSQIRTIGK